MPAAGQAIAEWAAGITPDSLRDAGTTLPDARWRIPPALLTKSGLCHRSAG